MDIRSLLKQFNEGESIVVVTRDGRVYSGILYLKYIDNIQVIDILSDSVDRIQSMDIYQIDKVE